MNVDTTTLEILQNKADLYNLSPGSSVRSKTPIVAKVAERCEHGYTIQLFANLHFDSVPGTSMAESSAYARKLVLTIENQHFLTGVLDSTLVLGPDKKHIIKNTFALTSNAHLIVKPGTSIFMDGKSILNMSKGKFTITGTADSLIVITDYTNNTNSYQNAKVIGNKNDTLKFVHFYRLTVANNSGGGGLINNNLKNCIIQECSKGIGIDNSELYNCNLFKNETTHKLPGSYTTCQFSEVNLSVTNIVSNFPEVFSDAE